MRSKMNGKNIVKIITLGVILTLNTLTVSAAELPESFTEITEENVAKEDNVFAGLDSILRQAYVNYSANNMDALYALDDDSTTKVFCKQLSAEGLDRYICKIDENISAMLYAPVDGGYWWYFGQIENGLRQGTGTTIVCIDSKEYMKYSGGYANDLPAGDGVLYAHSDWFEYSISGVFQGSLLNGIYKVKMTDPDTGEVSNANFPYVGNHLLPDFEEMTPDGTGSYSFYAPNNHLHRFYMDGQNFGCKVDVPEGSEIMVFGSFGNGENGYFRFVSYNSQEMNNGFPVLRGNPSASLAQTEISTDKPNAETIAPIPESNNTDTPNIETSTPEDKEVVAPSEQSASIPTTYTVKRGDNLCKIAKEIYGNEKYYIDIYNANVNLIKDDYIIYANEVLTIPSK